MRKKRLRIVLIIISLVVFCSMPLLFMGCYDISKIFYGTDSEYEYGREMEQAAREAEEQKAKKEEKQIEVVQEAPAEEVSEVTAEDSVEAEEESFPNEPVTYTGDIDGLPVIFVVNFKTTEVTGSLACPVEGYPDYVFTDGKVDPDTLEITARSTGIRELDSDGNVIQTQEFIITGKISGDLSTINGVIVNNFDESFEFIATK